MLERVLSPRGFRIYMIFMMAVLGLALWQLFTDSGLVAWLNRLQVWYLFSDHYYPELSVLIMVFPALFVGFAIGFLYDFVTRQGAFSGSESSLDFSNPGPNNTIGYQAATRKEVIDQVRAKFQTEIRQLKFLGFEELGFCREIVPWFGAPKGCLGVLGSFGVLANEITRIGPKLTVNVFTIAMTSRTDSTYAAVFNLGVKFYTEFADGTCLITATNKGIEFQDAGKRIYRRVSSGSLSSAWDSHKKWVAEFASEGRMSMGDTSMGRYIPLITREDEYLWKHRSRFSEPDRKKRSFLFETVTTLVSTVVSMSILIAVVSAFIFAGNVVAHIYPSCWFVKNLMFVSLPVNFLAVIGCLALSWILARFQDNLLTVNGMGTSLRGWTPTADPHGFISTKWLVLPGVPLIPVRSYLLTVEGTDRWNKGSYSMQRLDRIRWDQVRETVRGSWLGYSILTLLFLVFIVWEVAECG